MTKQFSMNPRRGYPGRLPYRPIKRSRETLIAREPAGNMRNHFVLQKPVEVRSGAATATITWQDVDADVWGNATSIQGIQIWYAQQFAPKSDTLVKIRFRHDIMDGWRLLADNGIAYVLRAVPTDVDGMGTIMMLHCQALQVGVQ